MKVMTQAERKTQRTSDLLKDRKDYRNALIERRNGIDVKLATVEDQIRKLK